MLLKLIDYWITSTPSEATFSRLAALKKITFRSGLAAATCFLIAVLFGPWVISQLKTRFREPIKSDSIRLKQLHAHKNNTPTMGGIFIVLSILLGIVLFADLTNPMTTLAILLVGGMAVLGAVDDLIKLKSGANGLSPRVKLTAQSFLALVVALLLFYLHRETPGSLDLEIPFTNKTISLGWWFVPLSATVIVGSSNAVNLTDGLDGLAGGCLVFSAGAMAVLAYASGHFELAEYLNILRVPGAGEMTVIAATLIGAVLGFLWFNCHPAQVFMGDVGSLPLGALLGFIAVAIRQEFLFVIIGGVFVCETLSVILQVSWFKATNRRIFLCAPLHHHFQFKGWGESKIVVRFWIAAALCSIMGLVAAKVTISDSPRSARSSIENAAAENISHARLSLEKHR